MINLREDFMPRKGRTYLMSREEKEEVREFVEEQLRKGYIRPSKSPQTSPVFFVEKKKKVGRRVRAIEKLDRDEWKMSMEEKFDNEVKLDKEKVRKIVLPRFHK